MRTVLTADSGADALSALIDYAFRVREVLNPGTVIDIMQTHLGRPGKELTMTAADRLMEEGHARGLAEGKAEGMLEGKAEGKAEILVKLLRLRFGPPDAALLARLAGATAAQLDALAEAILTAPDLPALLRVFEAEPAR